MAAPDVKLPLKIATLYASCLLHALGISLGQVGPAGYRERLRQTPRRRNMSAALRLVEPDWVERWSETGCWI